MSSKRFIFVINKCVSKFGENVFCRSIKYETDITEYRNALLFE